jgi:peptidoglycan/xylan/chitin deacetylase (PgdA/CDA1 family)
MRHGFVPLEVFERQMAFLARRRRVVDLAQLVSGTPRQGRPPVAITFDDAYRSVLTRAVPVLERLGFPATVFAPTAWLGDRNRWDPEYDLELDLLSAEELIMLRDRGFDIGSHGHRHIDFSSESEAAVRADLQASVACLEEMLGERPRFLAYPYGRTSAAARRLASDLGFEEAFALEWQDAPFARSRTPVFPRDTGWRFAFKASGHYAPLRRARVVESVYARLLRPLRRSRVSAAAPR